MTSGSKIAVVTGSSKGIGKAIALAFAKLREYGRIVVNSRRLAEAKRVADEIKSSGCDSITIDINMSKENDCIKLIEETTRYYSRIICLPQRSSKAHAK
jgi:NAD(P)-dependent dehydrogenase (short-subunit alcohol dehydrogenase family)